MPPLLLKHRAPQQVLFARTQGRVLFKPCITKMKADSRISECLTAGTAYFVLKKPIVPLLQELSVEEIVAQHILNADLIG